MSRPRAAVLAATVLAAGLVISASPHAGATTAPSPAGDLAPAAACENGYVALTYDDGPNPSTTQALLTALRNANARATFFNLGQRVQQNPGLAQAQVAAGHWVANHSWSHPHLTQLSSAQINQELSQTQSAIQQATGVTPRLFRPPYGETNGTVQSVASQLGLREIIWSVDSQDWNGASTAQIVAAANNLQSGGIILMHDAYQNTINAVPQIVANLANRGLCPGMISPTTGRAVAPDGGGTTPPTTPPPTTPPPGSSSCTATYAETQRWGDRFNGQVTIRAGSTALTGWTSTVTLSGGQRVSTTWNGTPTWDSSGLVMTVRPNGNGNLSPGASTTFGFTVMANGTWTAPSVTCRTP